MRIEVTQADIDSAGHGSNNCPIARACERQGVKVMVLPKEIRRLNGPYKPLPIDAQNFVFGWDFGLWADPCTFEVPGL